MQSTEVLQFISLAAIQWTIDRSSLVSGASRFDVFSDSVPGSGSNFLVRLLSIISATAARLTRLCAIEAIDANRLFVELDLLSRVEMNK